VQQTSLLNLAEWRTFLLFLADLDDGDLVSTAVNSAVKSRRLTSAKVKLRPPCSPGTPRTRPATGSAKLNRGIACYSPRAVPSQKTGFRC
jgi:hypothetical protein